MNQVSLRFAPQPIGGAVIIGSSSGGTERDYKVGADIDYDRTSSYLTLQGKFFWTLIDRQNSDFYIGALAGLLYSTYEYDYADGRENTDEDASFLLGVLAGVEWRLTELPEIGLNFEVGYNFDFGAGEYESKNSSGTTTTKYEEESVFGGTYVSLGATYYF